MGSPVVTSTSRRTSTHVHEGRRRPLTSLETITGPGRAAPPATIGPRIRVMLNVGLLELNRTRLLRRPSLPASRRRTATSALVTRLVHNSRLIILLRTTRSRRLSRPRARIPELTSHLTLPLNLKLAPTSRDLLPSRIRQALPLSPRFLSVACRDRMPLRHPLRTRSLLRPRSRGSLSSHQATRHRLASTRIPSRLPSFRRRRGRALRAARVACYRLSRRSRRF
jgi:hypothetical protein